MSKVLPTVRGQSLELAADIYNVLNLISRRWGQSRVTAPTPVAIPLALAGWDATAGRGVYRLQLPALRRVQDLESRWQLEISVRYLF